MKNVLKSSSEKMTPLLQSVKDTGMTVLKNSSRILLQLFIASTLTVAKGIDTDAWTQYFKNDPSAIFHKRADFVLLEKKIQKKLLENALLERGPAFLFKFYRFFLSIDRRWCRKLARTIVSQNTSYAIEFLPAIMAIDRRLAMRAVEKEAENNTYFIFSSIKLLLSIDRNWAIKIIETAAESKPMNAISEIHELVKIDRDWAMRLIEKIAFDDPISILSQADKIISIDTKWGMNLVEKVVKSIPNDVIEQAQFLGGIDKLWAKKVINEALDQKSIPLENDIFLESMVGLMFIDRKWAIELIKQFFRKIIEEKSLEENTSIIISQAEVLITVDRKWALSLFELVMSQEASDIFDEMDIFLNIDREWTMKLIEKYAVDNAYYVMRYKEDLLRIDRAWAIPLIKVAAPDRPLWVFSDPRFFVNIDKKWGMNLLVTLAPHNSRIVLNKFRSIAAFSEKLAFDCFQRAAEELPSSALYLAPQVIKINEEKGKKMIEKVIDEAPFDAFELKGVFDSIDTQWGAEMFVKIQRIISLVRGVIHMNNLHNESASIRYKGLENASLNDLYDMMVYGREEIYTSSYNEIFRRFLQKLKEKNMNFFDFIEQKKYMKLGVFFEAAAAYGRIDDLLLTLKDDSDTEKIFSEFIRKTFREKNMQNIVVLTEILLETKNMKLVHFLEKECIDMYENMREGSMKDSLGLLFVYFAKKRPSAIMNTPFFQTLDSEKYTIASLERIPSEDLFDEKNRNIQQYFFYDDEDGHSTFQGFLARYQNDPQWSVDVENESFVLIQSTNKITGKQIFIYANRPGFDGYSTATNGVEVIKSIMKEKKMIPSVIVHRGHSYHVGKTIPEIPKETKLTSLGSCGGYQNFKYVLSQAPNSHIFATKGTGTKFVNEPAFKFLNDTILSGKDLVWEELWEQIGNASSVLKKYKQVKDDPRFKHYISPDKNFGAAFGVRLNELDDLRYDRDYE